MNARERLRTAIELGARLGLLPAAAVDAALASLAGGGPADPSLALVASWLGCEEQALADLLRLADAADTPTLRAGGAERLANALLSTPPTAPPGDIALPTTRLGTPEAAATAPAHPPPVPHAHIPDRLGPYVRGEELGRGGMGIVFRARHEKLGSPCALKVMVAGEHAPPPASPWTGSSTG